MMRRIFRLWLLAALTLFLSIGPAGAQTLKIGIAEDPDILDPVLNRTFVGAIVLNVMCDRLFAVAPDNQIVPNLASSYGWSDDGKQLTIKLRQGLHFQDGETLDAAAVKFTIERDINFPGSIRRSEFPPLDGITVVDPDTVRIDLKAPFPPLIEVLSAFSGIILSPKGTQALGPAGVGNHPPCVGPFKLVERVAQDRIVLQRTENYWDAGRIKLDRIIFQPLPDSTVRIANLKSGDLDFIERVQPTDFLELAKDSKLGTASATQLGYQAITINVGKNPRAQTPLGQDTRVRKALDLSIDRDAINQVVAGGLYTPDNQFQPPESPYHVFDLPAPKRDIAEAKRLLAEAGAPHPSFTLMMGTSPVSVQLCQMIQAMAGEAGFDIKLQQTDFTTSLDAGHRGDFEAFQVGWSGYIDPDGNSFTSLRTDGANNYSHYSNPEIDALFDQGRATASPDERKGIYAKISEILERDLPIIYLYHTKWLWAFSNSVHGFVPVHTGVINIKDLSKS
jgi:peptide/nickel transport system substrate-binding protein